LAVPSREPVSRVSFSLRPELLDEFNRVSEVMGFSDRSKALQMAIRSFIAESEVTRDRESMVTGTILVLYNHEIKGIDKMLTEVGHEYAQLIVSSLHVHLEGSNCLSVIVIKGQVKLVMELEQQLRGLGGVTQLKFAYLQAKEGKSGAHTHVHLARKMPAPVVR
jgi:CopG family transcriptional regulator, nickel-responsive regulator